MIKVEVAFALPHEQKIISLQVAEDCSAYEAVIQSVSLNLPQIDPENDPMGFLVREF